MSSTYILQQSDMDGIKKEGDALQASLEEAQSLAQSLLSTLSALPPQPPPVVTPPVVVPPAPIVVPNLPEVGIEATEIFNQSVKISPAAFPGAAGFWVYDSAFPDYKVAVDALPAPITEMPTWDHVNGGWIYPPAKPACVQWDGPFTSLIVEAIDRLAPFQNLEQGAAAGIVNGRAAYDISQVKVIGRSKPLTPLYVPRTAAGVGFVDDCAESDPFLPVSNDSRLARPAETKESKNWTAIFYACNPNFGRDVFMERGRTMTCFGDYGFTEYASVALILKRPFDIVGGKVLKVTGQFPPHGDGRRWSDIAVFPFGDIISQNAWKFVPYNPFFGKSGLMASIDFQIASIAQFDASIAAGEHVAGSSPRGDNGLPCWRCTPDQPSPGDAGHRSWQNGTDNASGLRHTYDLYVSQTEARLYEEGVLKVQWPLAVPLTNTKFQIAFLRHIYHDDLEGWELRNTYREVETLYENCTPHIEMTTWANLGAEIVDAFPALPVATVPT